MQPSGTTRFSSSVVICTPMYVHKCNITFNLIRHFHYYQNRSYKCQTPAILADEGPSQPWVGTVGTEPVTSWAFVGGLAEHTIIMGDSSKQISCLFCSLIAQKCDL